MGGFWTILDEVAGCHRRVELRLAGFLRRLGLTYQTSPSWRRTKAASPFGVRASSAGPEVISPR